MSGSKQTKQRLPAAPRDLVQRNETDLVELNAVRSDIPLRIIWVAPLVAISLAGGYQYLTATEIDYDELQTDPEWRLQSPLRVSHV